jgi:hypothetical protein
LGHSAHTWSEVISPNAVSSPHSGYNVIEMLTFQHSALAPHPLGVDFQQPLDLGVADTPLAVPRTSADDDLRLVVVAFGCDTEQQRPFGPMMTTGRSLP